MDVEEIREGVLAILKELHEDIDFEAEDKMVEDKILDSFDLVTLVTELGEEFDVDIENTLIDLIKRPHISGLTVLGGEPLELENRNDVFRLLKRVKECCKDKTIWLYSAFLYEDIKNFDVDILSYVDVLVDGQYVDELHDFTLKWCGSSNQRVIDIKKSKSNKKVVLYEEKVLEEV